MVPIFKKAWIAGIVDGEGYIARIRTGEKNTRLVIRVDNTNKFMLKELVKYFGGNIRLNKRTNRPNSKPCWYWRLYHTKAEKFLKEILPYLVAKRDIAIDVLG